MFSWRKMLALVAALLLFVFATAARAQSSSEDDDAKFTLSSSVQGTSNSLGHVTRFDVTPGYSFNRFLGVFGGLPVYIVRPSADGTAAGMRSANGLGNLYVGVAFRVHNPLLNFESTLTGTAPTGDPDKGLSTGRVAYDWNNHFDRSFFRLTPFANIGIASTVSDTPFFTRPFSTSGFVSHYELGATYRLIRFLGVGASTYAIVPAGEQKVFSRLVGRRVVIPGTPRRGRVFELQGETIGGSDLTRDNGFSAWFAVTPVRAIELDLGYTRSIRYALDSVAFAVRVDITRLIREAQGQSPTPPAKGADPSINDSWKSSDVKPLVERLETESREIYHERAKLADLVAPKPGSAIADIGAGSGFMVMEFARRVGAGGKVFAVDINAAMMELVAQRAREQGFANVQTVVTREDTVDLPPNSTDLVFICDTYHHFENPRGSLAGIYRALKPGGQMVVVEFDRIPGKTQQWILDHVRADQEEVTKEITAAGFELVQAMHPGFLSENYVLRFRKLDRKM